MRSKSLISEIVANGQDVVICNGDIALVIRSVENSERPASSSTFTKPVNLHSIVSSSDVDGLQIRPPHVCRASCAHSMYLEQPCGSVSAVCQNKPRTYRLPMFLVTLVDLCRSFQESAEW